MTIKRITFLQELLAFMGLKDRLHLAWISSAEAGKFVEVVDGFTEKIRSMGPNPLKGYDLKPWLSSLQPAGTSIENNQAPTPLPNLETV